MFGFQKEREKMNKGYDVADWLNDGGTMEQLDAEPVMDIFDDEDDDLTGCVGTKKTQADMMIDIIERYGIHIFLDELNEICVSIPINGHKEVWLLESKEFADWAQSVFYRENKRPIKTEGFKQVISILSAKAKFENRKDIHLFNRVAEYDNAIWYDLSNETWQAVKVTCEGWRVVDNPPTLFKRFRHQKPQVLPQAEGDIQRIFKYINLKENSMLFQCWLVSCFIPEFPHTISVFYGEKGAAKSTTCTLLKRLIDPSALDTLGLSRDQRTLVVNLSQHWYLPFDNVSSIDTNTSDMLCRAITGGGIQQRKMCTNAEDFIFTFQRCISLNGINNVVNRADLLDRSLLFELERVSETDRKELKEIYNSFEKDRAFILGGIFNTLVKAKNLYNSVKLDKLPRMADFARWGYAIGEALGGCGKQFLEEYAKNQTIRDYEAIDADVVATLIVAFMEKRNSWVGMMSELLVELQELAPSYGINAKAKEMPTRPNLLSRRINTVKSNLCAVGITYTKESKNKGTYIFLKNNNLSPLPPYGVDCLEIVGLSNGDNNGDVKQVNSSPPYRVSLFNGDNGDDGDNGDEFDNVEF